MCVSPPHSLSGRSCNESAAGGRDVAAAVGRGLAPLGDEVRQATRESRQAMNDHTSALHKVAQVCMHTHTHTGEG